MIKVLLLLFVTAYANAATTVNCEYEPKCMDKIDTQKLPVTEKDIQEACNAFRQAQECVENWGKQCLSVQNMQQLRAKLEKPFQFQKSICTDDGYRNEYLKEQDSIQKIGEDWKKCTVELQTALKDAPNVQKDPLQSIKHMCCINSNFGKCTNDICKDKCSEKGSSIVANLVKDNIDVMASACAAINLSDCPAYTPSKSSHMQFSVIALMFMMVVQVLIR